MVKAMVFPGVTYSCESWTVKKAECLWTVVLEKTPESPLDSKEIQPVNLKGDQPWIYTGRTDAEAAASVFCSSDANRQLIRKVPGAGKDWGQKEKRVSEDEMAGQYHQSNEHELGKTPEDCEVQGSLACYSPWGRKESDTTGRLNNKHYTWATQVALVVKNPPANAGDIGDIGLILEQKDPPEEEMATHFSMRAWKIPGTEEPRGLSIQTHKHYTYNYFSNTYLK